jgi:8-oxo-dGTP diphosphatase
MVQVKFYDPEILNNKFIYSVIVARYWDKWVYVRHHKRVTFEIPGGHIEEGETPDEAASRELNEETGATEFRIECVSSYSVTIDGETRFGRLYYAEISALGPVPDVSEIEEVKVMDGFPDPVTYPDIQPLLYKRVLDYLGQKSKGSDLK